MLISKSHLSRVADEYVRERSTAALSEAVAQAKRPSRAGEVTVFLSHKHDDDQELRQAIALLHSLGVSVYVDWMDEDMPSVTSGKTAQRIKQKITGNKKFILLATQGAISSKWCNWELGFGDAHKFADDIALLPVTENDGTWKGNEYLQIYPAIHSESQYPTGTYYVQHGTIRIPLRDWLRR